MMDDALRTLALVKARHGGSEELTYALSTRSVAPSAPRSHSQLKKHTQLRLCWVFAAFAPAFTHVRLRLTSKSKKDKHIGIGLKHCATNALLTSALHSLATPPRPTLGL